MSSAKEGLIPVEEFAKRKGMKPEKVIAMIKDGFHVGQISEDQWYVSRAELTGASSRSGSTAGTASSSNAAAYKSDYETARKVAMVISALGWIIVAVGVVAAIALAAQSRYGDSAFMLALPGLALSISGLFLVAGGQVTRATVDNADHTREILHIISERSH